MDINTDQMMIARRLNGGLVNGYGGFYQHQRDAKGDYLVIVIPESGDAVEELMERLEIAL